MNFNLISANCSCFVKKNRILLFELKCFISLVGATDMDDMDEANMDVLQKLFSKSWTSQN